LAPDVPKDKKKDDKNQGTIGLQAKGGEGE
jgi:hypothetical protein